jgi:hypothetical protein
MIAGWHCGISKDVLLMLWAVYAATVVARLIWPLTPSPPGVWTEAVFAFSSC